MWRVSTDSLSRIKFGTVHDDGTCTGLSEDDLESSVKTLKRMAADLNGHASIIRKFKVQRQLLSALLHSVQVPKKHSSNHDG